MAQTEAPTLWRLLEAAAREQADATALIYGGQRHTYAQLRAHAQALAAGLQALGIAHGDRVAIWLPNVPLWVALQLACARLGAVVVALNTRFKSAELGDILGRSGAKLLVYWPEFRGIDFTGMLEGVERACLRDLRHVVAYTEDGKIPREVCGLPVIDSSALLRDGVVVTETGKASDGCVLYTTSGTTSRPKLVLHTQQSIASHAMNTAQALGYDAPGTVIKVVTPLCGVSGFGMPFAALAARAPCVLTPAFEVRESLELIRRHRVTHIHANHEIIRRWLENLTAADDVSSLKLVNCGSGMAGLMEPAAAQGITLQSIYGSSEMQARFSRQRGDIAPERVLEAGGFPLSSLAKIRVASINDSDTGRILPHGEKGELQFCAPSQMHSYFGDAAATARGITEDGFVRTGDCGYTRADGSFVLEARIGDVLKLSGFMVSPAEIEALLLTYPGVAQCQVVGVQGERGLRAVAFVRCAGDFDEAAVMQFCGERIARYKVPARIVRLDEFPMTAGANAPKVQKNRLREMAQALF
jgi:fatty-acyl-CoA synthase